MFICDPSLIKFLQVLGHIVYYFLDCHINIIFDYTFIDVADHTLDNAELLEQLATCIKNLLRENIFFTIYPKVGEAFLG